MANNVKVVGLTELGAALDLLPRKIEQEYIRTAVKKGAEVIRADAEARAPKLSGDMASKITVKTLTSRFKGTFTAIIGVRFMRLLASFGRHGHAPSSEDPGIYSRFVKKDARGRADTPTRRLIRSSARRSMPRRPRPSRLSLMN